MIALKKWKEDKFNFTIQQVLHDIQPGFVTKRLFVRFSALAFHALDLLLPFILPSNAICQ